MERKLGIEYTNPYNAEADRDDNIWVATDNYLSMYDQQADKFTHYPFPVRSDSVKTTIAENGGIWFIYRNAGQQIGYGGTAVVLYPDKDEIESLAALSFRRQRRVPAQQVSLARPRRGWLVEIEFHRLACRMPKPMLHSLKPTACWPKRIPQRPAARKGVQRRGRISGQVSAAAGSCCPGTDL